MKFAIVIFAVIAAASAQYNPFNGQYNLGQGQYNPFARKPAYSTTYRPFVSSTPAPLLPYVPSTFAPLATAAPVRYAPVKYNGDSANAKIVRYDNEVGPDGSYAYAYETDNGIAAQAQGVPRNFGGNPPVAPVVSQGSFSWTSPEGVPVVITYKADENGYEAQGEAIPTPPAIPELILRSLQYIASQPAAKQQL